MSKFMLKTETRNIAVYKTPEAAFHGVYGYAAVQGYDVIACEADADNHGCLDVAMSKAGDLMIARVDEVPCECMYCGATEDEAQLNIQCYGAWSGMVDDLICEECFHGSDDGPCWDDLPQHGNPAWWS